MQPHPHPAGYLSYRDSINNLTSEHHASIMRDDRDIQRPKPASAPEKGRGPQCGKDRRSATVCPCRCVPPGCKSVSGSTSCLPPATVSLQKCIRCPFPPSTWHGISAKAFQVSLPASHLARNPCESVPGVSSRCPPATEPPRKRSRWETSSGSTFLPSTCHSVPADVLAVNGSRQAVTWTMLPPFRPEDGSMRLCRGSPGFPCQSNRSAISAASILPARSSGTKDHRPTTSGALIAAGSILPCSVR